MNRNRGQGQTQGRAEQGLWLSPANHPQIDLTACPEIIATQQRARRLLRRRTPQQLIFAHLAAIRRIIDPPGDTASHQQWQQRLHRLKAANRHLNNPAIHQDLIQAAIYPDALDQARRCSPPEPGEHRRARFTGESGRPRL